MLSSDCIRLEVRVVAFSPDGVEPVRVQAGKELGAGCADYAMRWVQVVAAAEEGAMIRGVPVLSGIDASERQREQGIDRGDYGGPAGDRQLGRAQLGEAALHVHDQQRCGGRGKHNEMWTWKPRRCEQKPSNSKRDFT